MREWSAARHHVQSLKATDPRGAERLNREITAVTFNLFGCLLVFRVSNPRVSHLFHCYSLFSLCLLLLFCVNVTLLYYIFTLTTLTCTLLGVDCVLMVLPLTFTRMRVGFIAITEHVLWCLLHSSWLSGVGCFVTFSVSYISLLCWFVVFCSAIFCCFFS